MISIPDPFNRQVHTRVSQSQGSAYQAEFTPNEVGPHSVSVLFGGQPVPGSPATTFAYDASRVKIVDVTPSGGLAQERGFTGEYSLESLVKNNID